MLTVVRFSRGAPKQSKMAAEFVCFSFALLLMIQLAIASPPISKPNCESSCGNVSIPYPFGMGKKECYFDEWFEIDCNKNVYPPRAFMRRIKMEVFELNLGGSAMVRSPIISSNCSGRESDEPIDFKGSPFYISEMNSIIAVGCNSRALLVDQPLLRVGCESRCHGRKDIEWREMIPKLKTIDSDGLYLIGSDCNGTDCCKIVTPSAIQVFNPKFEGKGCELAFLVLEGAVPYVEFPMQLYWTINSTLKRAVDRKSAVCSSYPYVNDNGSAFSCYCDEWHTGNPYVGCTDFNECETNIHHCHKLTKCVNTPGSYKCVPDPKWIIIIVVCGVVGLFAIPYSCWRLYKLIKKIRNIHLKKKFFKRNGGSLLKQQLNSSDGTVQKTKVFSSKEMEKATDRFNENRILGHGGQGTVYKGMLTDGSIVAIKKFKLVDEGKVQEFINEVAILSQINHRNIVKLLGCCLETEVPLLVYEFIPNGSLFQYLHDQSEEATLPWEMRLRIAGEIARALEYLHSSASIPIYHRDIKSTNILLDERNRAKVSDFGTSKSIAIDQTHLTTHVQGTFGYLDPEYFQTSQFTDKSDVYSFGVVLVELLSGQKPICSKSSEEITSLATHFIILMEENRLFDIVDARIKEHCAEEEIIEVANLAKRCLNLNGKKRPTMKEVGMELEGIQASRNKLNIQQNNEEIEDNLSDDDSITESYESQETLSDEIAITVSCDLSNVKTLPMVVESITANRTW